MEICIEFKTIVAWAEMIWLTATVGEREIGRMDRRALTPLSVQLSTQQPGSNEAGSRWNSHSVHLQQITESRMKTGEGGRERLSIFG